tara:strand:+ start:905 stop:1114 length:210 start_codon:yes stop_codon:yes gene_type:complete
MAMYKILNNKKVKLTKAEETARKEEIKQAEIRREQRDIIQKQKESDKESAISKLKDLGLTENEIDALIN